MVWGGRFAEQILKSMYSQITIYQKIILTPISILLESIYIFFCKVYRNGLTLVLKAIMGKVRFYLERPEKGKAANITLYFSYRRDILKMATSEKILPEHWDDKTQRPLRRLLSNTKLQYKGLSDFLDDLEEQTLSIYTSHRRERKLLLLDKKRFRYLLKSYLEGSASLGGMTFFQYLDHFINEREKSNYSEQTIKQYKATRKHLLTFADKYLGYRFGFDDVGLQLFKSFRDYFWNNRRNYSDNTVHKYISHFKNIVAQAYKEEYHNNDKFNIEIKTDLRVGRHSSDAIALTIDEVFILKDLELPSALAQVRDIFLVGCFTGLRISDWHKIDKSKIIQYKGNDVLKIFTTKSKKVQYLPIMPVLASILEKYDYKLPKFFDQKINERIKECAKIAGFDTVETYRRIEQGKHVEYKEKRYNRISAHTTRRTFATILRSFDMPASKAKLLTGHSSEKMFSVYDKTSELNEIAKLSENQFFSL